MSVSSGSSLCGDADQDLLLDDEEEIDFYAVLNVPRDATEDEINKAYRKRCLIFHPDRHIDENDKRDAEKVFVNLRRAHETLTDQKKRAVYDALGIQGLDAQGWELVTRSSNPENIRKEYEFLQRLKEQELMLQRIHPSTGFVVKTSLVGLFQEAPEERFGPQLLGMSISQSVDCAMTGTDRVGIVGRVKTGNGRGDGNVTVMWKKTAGPLHFENNLTVSGDAVGASCRVSRNVFQRAAVIVQPQLQYSLVQQMFVPSLTLIYSMRLRLRWQGSLILSWSPLQSGVTTSIVHTENNQPKAVANFTLSPTNSNIRAVYYLRDIHSDAFTEMACQMSLFGLSPSIHFERRLSRFSRVGCTVNFSFPACLLSLKLKLKTGQSSFDWHILLCDDKETLSRSVILGLAVPYFSIKLFKLAFRPWCDRISALFDDHSHDREVDAAKQEESGRIINLMRPTAERIKKEEEQKHGIIVVEAKYGQCDSSGSRAYPLPGERTIDVTIPVQSMVNDSQLRIYAVKNQLPGFYDPCPGEPKMLYIKYLFRDAPHLVIVNDDMPLQIPMRGRMTEKSAPPPGFNIPSDGNSSTASAPPVSAAESTPSPPYPNMGSAYPGPPPSYQSAMTYPASAPVYPPNPMPNAAPYPAQPVYVPPSITVTQLPQPPPQQHSTQRVVYHVAQGPACSHCGTVMRRESDLCCIICLVLLTIFTFPFGLLFLCCLPCAVQMRCPGCGRSS